VVLWRLWPEADDCDIVVDVPLSSVGVEGGEQHPFLFGQVEGGMFLEQMIKVLPAKRISLAADLIGIAIAEQVDRG
jgi:hypothetical protein